jgi:hypothetical protein
MSPLALTILVSALAGAAAAWPLLRLAYRIPLGTLARAERLCRYLALPLLGLATFALFVGRYLPRDVILPMAVVAVYAGAIALFIEIVFERRTACHHACALLLLLGILLSEGLLLTAPQ